MGKQGGALHEHMDFEAGQIQKVKEEEQTDGNCTKGISEVKREASKPRSPIPDVRGDAHL